MGKNKVLSIYLNEEAFFRLRALGVVDQFARAKKRGYISNMVCNLIVNHLGEPKERTNIIEEQNLISKMNKLSKLFQKYESEIEETKIKLAEVKKRNGTYNWRDKE